MTAIATQVCPRMGESNERDPCHISELTADGEPLRGCRNLTRKFTQPEGWMLQVIAILIDLYEIPAAERILLLSRFLTFRSTYPLSSITSDFNITSYESI